MRSLRKGFFMQSKLSDLWSQVDFINSRREWLAKQPMDAFGKLLREDDRQEAGMLLRLVEELEVEILAL